MSAPVGLSKAGGDFAVGYRGAKKLRKDMAGKTIRLEREYYDNTAWVLTAKKRRKRRALILLNLEKKKKKKKSKLSLKQKILKALKITAKGAGGAAAIAGELAVPNKAGAPTLPQGYHSWSPRKKSQYVNSLRRK